AVAMRLRPRILAVAPQEPLGELVAVHLDPDRFGRRGVNVVGDRRQARTARAGRVQRGEQRGAAGSRVAPERDAGLELCRVFARGADRVLTNTLLEAARILAVDEVVVVVVTFVGAVFPGLDLRDQELQGATLQIRRAFDDDVVRVSGLHVELDLLRAVGRGLVRTHERRVERGTIVQDVQEHVRYGLDFHAEAAAHVGRQLEHLLVARPAGAVVPAGSQGAIPGGELFDGVLSSGGDRDRSLARARLVDERPRRCAVTRR